MARDRKRARQRRERPARRATSPQVPAHVPGPVEHASGDVDEIDAAIARGASLGESGGSPLAGDPDASEQASGAAAPGAEAAGGAEDLNGALDDEASVAAIEEVEDEEEAKPAKRADGAQGRKRQSIGARTVAFLRACSAELQRMQWPDRRQTSQATAVVLGFVVVAGVYLGIADWVAQKIVNFIL